MLVEKVDINLFSDIVASVNTTYKVKSTRKPYRFHLYIEQAKGKWYPVDIFHDKKYGVCPLCGKSRKGISDKCTYRDIGSIYEAIIKSKVGRLKMLPFCNK